MRPLRFGGCGLRAIKLTEMVLLNISLHQPARGSCDLLEEVLAGHHSCCNDLRDGLGLHGIPRFELNYSMDRT